MSHRSSGLHVIADLYGIGAGKLSDPALLDDILKRAALAAGATILFSHFHQFGEGGGVTGVVLLAESHITIHTWPEHGFAAADVFMCGNARPERALEWIRAALQPASSDVHNIERGEAASESFVIPKKCSVR